MTDNEFGFADYDCAWQSGPGIEEWMKAGRVNPEDLQTLIETDLIYRQKLGSLPTRDEFRERFPNDAAVVEAAFAQAAAEAASEVKKFGDYHVVPDGKCRHGAMGVVWPVKHHGSGNLLAAKVTRTDKDVDSTIIKDEINTLKGLASSLQHVVPLFDHGIDGRESYYIMPWYEANNLDAWCGKKDVATILTMLIPVIRELNAIHSQGVLHQDIKPNNLLFDQANARVLLSDFGLARRVHEFSSGGVSGTEHYIAPELYQGQPASIQSDIYAMGATLFRLVSGQHPFGNSTGQGLKQRVLSEQPRQLKSICRTVKPDLSAIVGKCLETDLAQRYSNMGELADELQRFLDDEPVMARTPSWWARTRRWRKQNRIVSRSFTVTVSVLLGLIVLETIVFERDLQQHRARFVETSQQFRDLTDQFASSSAEFERAKKQQEAVNNKYKAALADAKGGYEKTRKELAGIVKAMITDATELKNITTSTADVVEEQIVMGNIGLLVVDGLLGLGTQKAEVLNDPRVAHRLDSSRKKLMQLQSKVLQFRQKTSAAKSAIESLDGSLKETLKVLE